MTRGSQSVLSFHHNKSAKKPERLVRLMRIVLYSPEVEKTKTCCADSRGVVGRRENDSKNL
jgi:hypothetical protein